MQNPFIATWVLNVDRSQFDSNHRPRGGAMTFELDADGVILMRAEGVTEKGEKHAERPQKFVPDGKPHPVPEFPGLVSVTTNLDPNTMQGEVRREDGTVVGKGVYAVSADGTTLTATTSGYDSQLRRFEVRTVWDRQQAQNSLSSSMPSGPS